MALSSTAAAREALAARHWHAIPRFMNDERALRAVQRIESALARIEAATDHLPPPRDDSDLRELRAVHQALRGKVEGAISQIDRLLATAEEG